MAVVKEEVIATALGLLDESGLEGLTMRKLAETLKIQAPSLYWHFASKDALLDGMAEALLVPVAVDMRAGEAWDVRLAAIANELRRALLSRRDAARVFAGTFPVSGNVLRVGSQVMECLKEAGGDERLAAWGTFTLLYYVLGFAIEEQAFTEKQGKQQAAHPPELLEAYPLAVSAMAEITGDSSDERFGFGLQMQIEGFRHVAARHRAAKESDATGKGGTALRKG
ncbi:TetR/AcrR family transcriptional regulator C-terminal domain-containing protein [Rhizobium cremeum]|uniref:TetR/AcrR family transcriptional regulator C-terminal domain-containing protein n=1 Tax=Rhizobium cremeum TaxID=2813827 RepID=UPI000DE1B334